MKATAIASAVFGLLQPTLAVQKLPTYKNPVLWNDLADLDVFRVDDTYYYSASTMAFSPGAPILKSGDLVNWEFVSPSSLRHSDFVLNPLFR
jgi:beta-xylosidase